MFSKEFRVLVTSIGGGLGFLTGWVTFLVGLEVCLELLFLGFLSESILILAAAIVLAPLAALATFAATWVAASVLHLAWHASVGILNLAWQGIKGAGNLLGKAWTGILNIIAKNRSTSSTTQNYPANPYGAQSPVFSEQQLTQMQEMLSQAHTGGYHQGWNDAFARMNSPQNGMYAQQHATPTHTDRREYQQPVTNAYGAYAYQAQRPSAPLYPDLGEFDQHHQSTVYPYPHQ
jgi:hypothetical protein